MDNDDKMVGTIWTRRKALAMAARAGIGLAAGSLFRGTAGANAAPTTQPKLPLVASPVLTEGPFFVDENLNRSDLVSGTTRPSVINGQPLLLAFTVCKLVGADYVPLT